MPFYTYSQNNSKGFFKPPAHFMIIEADDFKEANEIVVNHDVYFGYQDDDCRCCGERWSPQEYDEWAKNEPTLPYADAMERFVNSKLPLSKIIRKGKGI